MLCTSQGNQGNRNLLLLFVTLAAWETGSGQVRYSVMEEAKHGTFVGHIAQDLRLELQELVPRLFQLDSKGLGDLLEVNLQNGILFVNSRIDREELCGRSAECSIHLEVILDRPLQVFHVEVEVKDINDNPPVFQGTQKNLFIAESRPLDSRIPLEGAADADIGENSLLTYRLSSSEYFSLDVPTTDQQVKPLSLVLRKPLDREESPGLHLVLTATDRGKPELTGTVQLLINVLDANDNAPVFDRTLYAVQLAENVPNGTLVIKLNASDLDEGLNADIIYSFSSDSSPDIKFKFYINPVSGEIIVTGHIDFEERKTYKIRVEATDKGYPSLTGHCTVLVEVLDANDNAPKLTIKTLWLPVKEDAQLGTIIALISVIDGDEGENGQVTCSLTPHVPFKLVSTFKNYYSLVLDTRALESHFSLEGASDADIGENALLTYRLTPNEYFSLEVPSNDEQVKPLELVLKKRLDREKTPEFNLLLTAADGGKPELTGTVQLFIRILDINDNDPEFEQSEYKVRLMENAAKETLVIQLNATDQDEGVNGEVTYSLMSIKPNGKPLFTLDENNGEVKVNGTLDYEENKFYEIEVQATDKGNPPMAGHCTVWVEILDANDNAPEITVTSLSLPVREDTQPSTVISLISVSDRDSGANGQIICFLTPNVPFKIVSTFKNYYSLVLDGTLDRESVSVYKLVVTARDGGSPSLSATASVSVEVADVNDNAPAFAQPEYTVFVKENNSPGCHIFTVSAWDADAQENALVSYSLVERRVGERALSSYVSVHAESGKVYALQPLDHEELELLQFQVSAHDAGVPPLGSNVTLQVFVLLVLTLLLYTALRCSAPPSEGACGPVKPRLVCSSAVGSWSYSQERRQRVCSGEGPPKTDLMAFSPSLPPGLDREVEERQEAGSNHSGLVSSIDPSPLLEV
uniref:Protocadherin alpha 11 n=1 Tax=Moschus moschiferus TaxID=68415 RepID=A0A8C6CES2_MOSMO